MSPLLPPDHEEGWTSYVWLIYLNVYLGFGVYVGAGWLEWLAYAAGLLLFLPLYFAAFWVDGRRRVPIIAAMTALGLAFTWRNPGASVFFVYAASFVAGAATGWRATVWIAAITLTGLAAAATAGPWMPAAALFVGVFAPLVGLLNLRAAGERRRDATRRLAHAEVARQAAIAERERIAADLHDLLGHTLSVIVLKADLTARLADRDPARAAHEAREVARVSREALAEVRQAVTGARAASLADELARARTLLETAGVASTIDTPAATVPAAGAAPGRALALVLREAVTNVVRHAQASQCTVRLTEEAGALVLTVRDNGRGGTGEGNGWRSMRQRVEALGGVISRRSGDGFEISARVPVRAGEGAP